MRNLASTGEDALLHIEEPVDLGRDQASVDAAIAYLRARRIEPDFHRDPAPTVVAATQELLDRLLGRGVCRVEPSGARLRRYGQTDIEPAADGSGYVAYLSGRGSLRGVVQVLIYAVEADGKALGIGEGMLAFVWPAARVARELVVNRLALPDVLAERYRELVDALIEQLALRVDDVDRLALGPDAARAQAVLPYLVGLREARRDPRRQLEGMGLDGTALESLAVQLENAADSPVWLLRLADLAGDEWDTPDGFRAWVEEARSIGEIGTVLDTLEPPSADTVAEGLQVIASAPERSQTPSETPRLAPPLVPSEVHPPASAEAPDAPDGLFGPVERLLAARSARREEISGRYQAILDRRERLARERSELEARIRDLDADEGQAADELGDATDELEALAEVEAEARHRAVLDVLRRGRTTLDGSAAAYAAAVGSRGGRDQASLAQAQRTVRDYEEMERRGLVGQLPDAVRERLRADAEASRAALHEMLGGRDPILVPVVVAAIADPALTLEIGLPFAGRDELEPGALQTVLAAGICEVLTETVRSIGETPLERVEHQSYPSGVSILRLRFAGPPPVTADDCAQFCATMLSDLGRKPGPLREAGVSIEARVEPDLESEG